jgi:hypothetical protein
MLFTEWLVGLIAICYQFAFAVLSSILFKPAWNCVAEKFLFDVIPERFLYIHFWEMVAIILVFSFIGEQVKKLVPTLVSINNG